MRKKSKRWKEITDATTFYLAKDMVPLHTVGKDGFRVLIKTLDPSYVLPGRKYFSQVAIPTLYQQHRGKLEAELGTIDH